MQTAVLTHTGLVRQQNEDSYVLLPDYCFFAVADGMGGHRAGAFASDLALKVIKEQIMVPTTGEDLRKQLANAVMEANRQVHEESVKDPGKAGMGTTLTALWLHDGIGHIAHIGDSRAYLLRDSQLILLTNDHSLVGELLRQGSLTAVEAQSHPQRNVLTRALGIEAEVKVDTKSMTLAAGDLLLLCTDGLTNMVQETEIKDAFTGSKDLQEALEQLFNLSLKRGGTDNITMLAILLD